jgi:hypothetical protein
VTSTLYSSKGGRKARRHSAKTRRWPLWAGVLIAIGIILILLAAAASAAIVLHGRGTLKAPASSEPTLQVSNIRLSAPLMPGGAVDLLISVRNPNAFGTRVDQVTLVGALRGARPAGCTSKVGGPVTRPDGYRLPPADRVLVGAGAKKNVVVRAAFTLAGSATTGCGFTAVVDVSATQLTPATIPTSEPVPTAPTSTVPPTAATTTAVTTAVPDTDPTVFVTPPPPGGLDCDPADPACVIAAGSAG